MVAVIVQQFEPDEKELVKKILESENRDHVVETILQTNEQVIARVTDGIYRQPASALRELISNAYDADATRVIIRTDTPRFERIAIEDNGNGMSPDILAYLLFNIGGSAKRNERGEELGITSATDPLYSPKGRRLIGKIGIGLFSVSQLTHSFQIITKTLGDNHRTIATVALRQFSDTSVAPSKGERRYESGKVKIWRERATDKTNHGTTVVLTQIRPQARDTLRSRDVWSAIEQNEKTALGEEKQAIEPPLFHVGRVDSSGALLKQTKGQYSSLPWQKGEKPEEAFKKLVDCVWAQVDEIPNPKLERIFDYYLRMVWQLALSVPLPYVDGHLFDQPATGWTKTFEISNKLRGSARPVEARGQVTIRKVCGLTDPQKSAGAFQVIVDDLELARPIKFRNLPTTEHALKHPLVFVGKCNETFSKIPPELSGGPLQFEAYLFWSPKIAPTEHQGSLIRIHGASGTLFDSTFMRYQVAEQVRLRQITCEIFVTEGLDSALNIDRESFNNAHPHVVFITRWLHGALRQLATAQKKAASEIRTQTRDVAKDARVQAIQEIARQVWTQQADDPASSPPAVEIVDDEKPVKRQTDSYVFRRSSVTSPQKPPKTSRERARNSIIEEKLKAIAQVLASFDLIDRLTKKEQEALLLAIYKILDEQDE
jgi:Histidine kinase-, DNA gyrase B-, and HSP90-like ATPase